ncbi:hypothetical protein EJ04DRAFT_518242 [Polyplosphaeria fusca]|uniref:Uncharacterized protein n=1 Tax=Polyplosphaeria fusca TaxID=682080 RepID=A0A9P4R8N4_9PLEO|nr:hypothetical protein EJ04DRAFT_518242 [Polyplosphaeria fusca]
MGWIDRCSRLLFAAATASAVGSERGVFVLPAGDAAGTARGEGCESAAVESVRSFPSDRGSCHATAGTAGGDCPRWTLRRRRQCRLQHHHPNHLSNFLGPALLHFKPPLPDISLPHVSVAAVSTTSLTSSLTPPPWSSNEARPSTCIGPGSSGSPSRSPARGVLGALETKSGSQPNETSLTVSLALFNCPYSHAPVTIAMVADCCTGDHGR